MQPALKIVFVPPPGGPAPVSGIPRTEGGALRKGYWQTHHAFEIGHGLRKDEHKVVFSTPFTKAPNVIVSLNGLDSSHAHNLRIRVYTKNVTNLGFTAVYETWHDTKIYEVNASWIAIGN
eukprot:TRINITY_DN1247_c0_g2_i1.p1 TRINITY_DN1247_c0_g2~~TRINITY_DN1247_c0_g2_i1.p1  ORF type:complete len:120 (+),score=21.91 TRINITY_DN1247_c0_g2_i1:44-403(+)